MALCPFVRARSDLRIPVMGTPVASVQTVLDVLGEEAARCRCPPGDFLDHVGAGVGVVVLDEPSRADLGWIFRSSATYRLQLVSRLGAPLVRLLTEIKIDLHSVVWMCEAAAVLPTRVGPTGLLELLQRATRRLLSASSSPFIQRVVEKLLQQPPPPGSVNDLANRLGTSPANLRYHWRTQVGDEKHVQLSELVSWAGLLWGLDGHAHRPRAVLAKRLGIHPRTVDRRSLRLTGQDYSTLTRQVDLESFVHRRVRRLFDVA